jgi:hypothetical protein
LQLFGKKLRAIWPASSCLFESPNEFGLASLLPKQAHFETSLFGGLPNLWLSLRADPACNFFDAAAILKFVCKIFVPCNTIFFSRLQMFLQPL